MRISLHLSFSRWDSQEILRINQKCSTATEHACRILWSFNVGTVSRIFNPQLPANRSAKSKFRCLRKEMKLNPILILMPSGCLSDGYLQTNVNETMRFNHLISVFGISQQCSFHPKTDYQNYII